MGMERIVECSEPLPAWSEFQKHFAAANLQVAIRMIDGLPAFPDEIPEDGWRELRVSTGGGMMTLRKQPNGLAIVVWGNADEALKQEWEKLTEAATAACGLAK